MMMVTLLDIAIIIVGMIKIFVTDDQHFNLLRRLAGAAIDFVVLMFVVMKGEFNDVSNGC